MPIYTWVVHKVRLGLIIKVVIKRLNGLLSAPQSNNAIKHLNSSGFVNAVCKMFANFNSSRQKIQFNQALQYVSSMQIKKQILFLSASLSLSVVLFVTSCANISTSTYGPIANDDFQNIFLAGIDDSQEEIVFYSRAIWYANKNGFKFLPAGKKSRKGVIVITDQAVYFSAWNSNKTYTVEFSTNHAQIELVRHAANDLLGRLVIKKTQLKNQFNSFEILGVGGAELPDKAETLTAFQIIQQLVRS